MSECQADVTDGPDDPGRDVSAHAHCTPLRVSPDQLRRGQRLAESRGHNIKTAASDVRTRSEETRHPDQSPPCHVRGERWSLSLVCRTLKTQPHQQTEDVPK